MELNSPASSSVSERDSNDIVEKSKGVVFSTAREAKPETPSHSNEEQHVQSPNTFLKYTQNDHKDMDRMGKIPQLRRNFRQISMISLICVMVSTWGCLLLANAQGLQNGGLAGLFWTYVANLPGFAMLAASLAEMASIAPTSGGMYHWVSEFAPPRYQKILSYTTGWMAVLSWQAGNASGAFIAGSLIGSLLTVHDRDFAMTNWQQLLFVIATVVFVWIVNVYLFKWLPLAQNVLMSMSISIFVAVICVLWAKAPHASAEDVFLRFTNGGHWKTMGLSVMVGQITAIYGLVGSDTAAHLAEEVADASLSVPRAIWFSFTINAAMGFVLLVSLLFAITDPHVALNDITGFSYLWVLEQALPNAYPAIYAISAVLLVLALASNVSFNTTSSRQLWAFARDGGIPFANYFAKVDPKYLLPVRSVGLTCIITVLLALLNMGSNIAFNAIISVMVVALMWTYFISIGCFLWYRITVGKPEARWTLGRTTGIVVNIGAMIYSVYAFFWSLWPAIPSTAADEFNWSVVIFGGVLVLSLVFYYAGGRNAYKSPVSIVLR